MTPDSVLTDMLGAEKALEAIGALRRAGFAFRRTPATELRPIPTDDCMPATAWRRVLTNDPCAYCGAPSRDVDHIVPGALRQDNGASNEIGACRRCNAQKKCKSLLSHLRGLPVGHNPEQRPYPSRVFR